MITRSICSFFICIVLLTLKRERRRKLSIFFFNECVRMYLCVCVRLCVLAVLHEAYISHFLETSKPQTRIRNLMQMSPLYNIRCKLRRGKRPAHFYFLFRTRLMKMVILFLVKLRISARENHVIVCE